MVVGEASIHNIMGGMESTGGVRLHNHRRKLKQRFDIIKKLGQGTYGKVQLGINKETGQEVAIKTIKKCKIETEADLVRIRREIQIMSSVQHPNIIHIYEVFENREKMVLVMEYAAGGELYDYLSERKVLTEQEARRIFRQIATAVFYCHKHKICHRDLKLENILLDQLGNAKIADFGLSNVFDEQRLLNTFCGSPLYASPEIVKGTPYHGPEVDCWSLGVLLYTLVYGAMPFDGSNFKRLVKQISQSDYFEPKKPSPASPLIKDMLTVCPMKRADIEKICNHWWVNESYEQNCLDIAEDLAAQTPVRLDLLLSLVPESASAEKLVVGDQQAGGEVANNMSSETLVPTRCHSVGSLMELDRNNSDRRIRELVEEEPRAAVAGDAKRKLETTPSMDETVAAGVKRKERSRRKERSDEKEPRSYRSTSRHHSAPIPNPITEEAMEVDLNVISTVPTQQSLESSKAETVASCLELIEETKEKSPSRERSKTPVVLDQSAINSAVEPSDSNKISNDVQSNSYVHEVPKQLVVNASKQNVDNPPDNNEIVGKEEQNDVPKNSVPNKEESLGKVDDSVSQKKLKDKALSLDSELSAETVIKPMERRRSKIFETAEKFNQLASNVESEKPKKIFIPGVNVGGAKRAFERKASLSSMPLLQTAKVSASKVIIDVPGDKKSEKTEQEHGEPVKAEEKSSIKEEDKKRAVDIITGAIGKPPMQRKVNGSPPTSPSSTDAKKLGLKIQLGPNDLRSATISVSTPVETKFPLEAKSELQAKAVPITPDSSSVDTSLSEEPTKSSKMEITLKSATLPRPRKTTKAEITLAGVKSPEHRAFKSEVEAKIDAFHPQKLRTQRSEIAFPVAAVVPQAHRSASLEPDGRNKVSPKERIIPIQVESDNQKQDRHSSTPPPKPPVPQRSMSQRSNSLSRQSTADSDTDSALGSTMGPEPIRKSPREYIIPIAVEGGGYVTPRSGSVEPESKNSTPTSSNVSRTRFGRPRRMSSLLSDASEDESPFSTLHRDNEDLLQRHMHRLRSSRPSRQTPEHADSLSSGEDDDDDGFELLTAENLFSTLLSRVRSLTQRLNVDDNKGSSFPSSRLLSRMGSNSTQGFWGLHEPLSRRLTESQFRRSSSRDGDRFGRNDTASPGMQSSPGTRSTPSRDSIFDMGSSSTLPRDKLSYEDTKTDEAMIRKDAQETLEHNFTPSLARRLSRQFIEQTRQSLPRSPSIPREKYHQLLCKEDGPVQHRGASLDRSIRRANSLLDSNDRYNGIERRSPKRSISLFDDDDKSLPPLPRQTMTLGRKYRDPSKSSFHNYQTEKIQEEPSDDPSLLSTNGFTSEYTSVSNTNSTSYETSPNESSSNILDHSLSYKTDNSRDFENRLLAAENLIKESKLKNLGTRFNQNLNSNYKDLDKCDKESLSAISDAANATIVKRRNCIPNLRMRSSSLSRDVDHRKFLAGSEETLSVQALSPERSLFSKFFRGNKEADAKEQNKHQKPKTQRRISRFLRPDFFDTPREESQYVKEKEAKEAAEKERRKSRFAKKRTESKEDIPQKELKNEANLAAKVTSETLMRDNKDEKQGLKSSFLHSLEKKLEKFRSGDDSVTSKQVTESVDSVVPECEMNSEAKDAESPTVTNVSPKNKMSSVLGLFKNNEATTSHSQSNILSKFKKNTYKGSQSDSLLSGESVSTSKIPTKCAKNDQKSYKKIFEKKSPEKVTESKKSPSKEKTSPPQRVSPEAKKISKLPKKPSPEKILGMKSTKLETNKDKEVGKISEKKKSPEKTVSKKNNLPEKASPEKTLDNKQLDSTNQEPEEKKTKIKKKVSSLSSLTKNSSVTKVDKADEEKEVKKVLKPKEESDEGVKKKKIVRVVKKVVKKSSDGCEIKNDDKENPVKATVKKTASLKKDKNLEVNTSCKVKRKSPEVQQSVVKSNKDVAGKDLKSVRTTNLDAITSQPKASRSNLKLDFSKIPQHSSFRNVTPSKKDLVKVESSKEDYMEPSKQIVKKNSSPNTNSENQALDKFSKITHRGIITGNEIIIDKSLRIEDLEELRNETQDEYDEKKQEIKKDVENPLISEISRSSNVVSEVARPVKMEIPQTSSVLLGSPSKDGPSDCSPAEEAESFDSWSVCSADMSRAPSELHSPTSPTYALYLRGDPQQESIVDRIRRKSFYSRFNDRKRKTSLTVPLSGISLSSSSTLPRKFSFRDNVRSLSTRKKPEKCYSFYGEDIPACRKSPIERDRYSDGGVPSYAPDLKSPTLESYLTSSYDPLRKYLRSPTRDMSRKYHSIDGELSSHRNLLGNSFLNDNTTLVPCASRSSSTLPRKYRSSVSNLEPKTVEYFEELLTPAHSEYLVTRRSPSLTEHVSKLENGYHDGNLDLMGVDKWKRRDGSFAEKFEDAAESLLRKESPCSESTDSLPTIADYHKTSSIE